MSFLIYVKRNYRLIALVERLPDTDKENIRWMVMIETNTSFKMAVLFTPVMFQPALAIHSPIPLLSQSSSRFNFSEIFLTIHPIALPVT
jgi:hypothetical protein